MCFETDLCIQDTYIHPNTCIYKYKHTSIHIYMCMHTYMHTYIQTYMHACIHTYIHTYMHTYMHAYILITSVTRTFVYVEISVIFTPITRIFIYFDHFRFSKDKHVSMQMKPCIPSKERYICFAFRKINEYATDKKLMGEFLHLGIFQS